MVFGIFAPKNSCDGTYDSLDVRFGKACDNDCSFCIEKTGRKGSQIDVEELINSTIDSGIKSVLIVGGEPFLHPVKLYEYVMGIRNHVDTIYITTSLPATLMSNRILVERVLTLVDGLNVSLQHYNWVTNNDVLKASSRHNRISILEHLCSSGYASKIRVSINLVKGMIDSRDELRLFLHRMQAIGVLHVKINELQNSDEYVSYEKMMGRNLPSPFYHGCQTDITFPGIFMRLTLKRSCFLVEETAKASLMDLFKVIFRKYFIRKNNFKVLYEDGKLENTWLKINV